MKPGSVGYRAYHASVSITNGKIGGSGTIIRVESNTAFVLTCKHLFDGGEQVISVTIPGQRRFAGKLAGTDRRMDLAAITVEGVAADTQAVPLVSSDTPMGSRLFQYGFPYHWRSQSGPHYRQGQLANEGVRGHLKISSGLESGDSGGGVFRTDTGELLGVGIWSSGGFVGPQACAEFLATCRPGWFGRGGQPNAPQGPQQPHQAPQPPAPGVPGAPGSSGPPGKDGRDGKDGVSPDLAPLIAAVDAINKRLDKIQSPAPAPAIDYEKLAAEVQKRLPPAPAYFEIQPLKPR